MLELLLTLLIIAMVFAVVVVFGGRLVVNRVTTALSRRHHELEWILSTGLAPEHWTHRFQRRLGFMQSVGFGPGAIGAATRWYKNRLERRLYGLLRYVEGSNIIADEAIRRTMASTLRHVGRTWEESTWEDVVPQDDAGD